MRLSFIYPFINITPEQDGDALLIERLPWVMPRGDGSYTTYWTYFEQIHAAFPHAVADPSIAEIRPWLAVRSDLKHIKPDWDRTKIRRMFFGHFQPRDYQCDGIYQLWRYKRAILADATGLGKTIQSAGAVQLQAIANPEDQRPVLVVCPSGLRYQWRDELASMLCFPGTDEPMVPASQTLILDGTPAKRKMMYRRPPQPWNAISFELLLRDEDMVHQWMGEAGFRAIIVDESSRLKDVAGKTFQAVERLVTASKAKQVYMLNATPIENGLDDLWAQLRVVCPWIFPHYSAFRSRFIKTLRFLYCNKCSGYKPEFTFAQHKTQCTGTQNTRYRPPFEKVIGYQNLHEATHLFRDRFIRRDYSDVPEQLPELIVCRHPVEMEPTQRRAYETIQNDPTIEAMEKLTTLVRRALYHEDRNFHSCKLEALRGILRELGNQKAVVASESKIWVYEAAKKLEKDGYRVITITGDDSPEQKNDKQRAFTSGDFQVLLGTAAIERGLNLQVASWFINADLPWNPAKWLQRVGRVRRIGSRAAAIRVVNIVAVGTVEMNILSAIYEKLGLFNRIFAGDIDSQDLAGRVNLKALIEGDEEVIT